MDSQSFNVSRMYTLATGPECDYNCPKCDCDGRDVGDTWYVEWQNVYDVLQGEARCSECECKSDGEGNTYAYCDYYYVDDYPIGSQTCPAPEEETYECHIESSTSGISLSLCL